MGLSFAAVSAPRLNPRSVVEAVIDDAIQPALDELQANAGWCAELAVDFIETKGEAHFVHRLFHVLRRQGATTSLEDRRRDLVIVHSDGETESPVVLEAKTIHALQLMSDSRVDRGFRCFEHKTTDLGALQSGRADILLAIIPRFWKGAHSKYWRQVGPNEMVPFGYPAPPPTGYITELDTEGHDLVGAATVRGQEWAREHGIELARRIPLVLGSSSDDLWIDLTLMFFVRGNAPSSESPSARV